MEEDYDKKDEVAERNGRPEVVDGLTVGSARKLKSEVVEQFCSPGPVTEAFDPVGWNGIGTDGESGKRAGDCTRGVGITAAGDDGFDSGTVVTEVTVPGEEHHGDGMVGVAGYSL